MSYYDKYIKYKSKYINLKTKGGKYMINNDECIEDEIYGYPTLEQCKLIIKLKNVEDTNEWDNIINVINILNKYNIKVPFNISGIDKNDFYKFIDECYNNLTYDCLDNVIFNNEDNTKIFTKYLINGNKNITLNSNINLLKIDNSYEILHKEDENRYNKLKFKSGIIKPEFNSINFNNELSIVFSQNKLDNYNYIVIRIILEYYNDIDDAEHANFLIIDNKRKYVIYFDPHIYNKYWSDIVLKYIKSILRNNSLDYELFSSTEIGCLNLQTSLPLCNLYNTYIMHSILINNINFENILEIYAHIKEQVIYSLLMIYLFQLYNIFKSSFEKCYSDEIEFNNDTDFYYTFPNEGKFSCKISQIYHQYLNNYTNNHKIYLLLEQLLDDMNEIEKNTNKSELSFFKNYAKNKSKLQELDYFYKNEKPLSFINFSSNRNQFPIVNKELEEINGELEKLKRTSLYDQYLNNYVDNRKIYLLLDQLLRGIHSIRKIEEKIYNDPTLNYFKNYMNNKLELQKLDYFYNNEVPLSFIKFFPKKDQLSIINKKLEEINKELENLKKTPLYDELIF